MDRLDALLEQVRNGNLDAYAMVVETVEPEVRACVAAHAVRHHQIDEVVQDALVQAYRKLDQYQGGGSFRAWVKAIARNRLRMELRQVRRAPQVHLVEAALIDARLADLDGEAPTEDRVERLRACLDRLDPALRQLIEAHHLQGLGLDDLAQRMCRTANWVAVRLYRIRRSLALCVEAADAR